MTKVSASDNDASRPNNLVTYAIESGSRDAFVIDPVTGDLTVSTSWRAPASRYNVTVAAVDAGYPPLKSRCHVNITVVVVEDVGPPVFQTSDGLTLVTSVAKDAQIGHVIYRCEALNPAGAHRLRYRWSSAPVRGYDVRGQPIAGNDSDYLRVRSAGALCLIVLCPMKLTSVSK